MNVSQHQRSANRISLASVAIVALALISCSSSQIIATLEDVVTAAEIAVTVIGAATGLPANTSAQIVTYLQAVSTATGQASVILAGAGTSAEKAARIVAAFARIAALNLPAGTPAQIVAVVRGVGQAVATFLLNFPSNAAPTVPVSATARLQLSNLKLRSDLIQAKLQGVKI